MRHVHHPSFCNRCANAKSGVPTRGPQGGQARRSNLENNFEHPLPVGMHFLQSRKDAEVSRSLTFHFVRYSSTFHSRIPPEKLSRRRASRRMARARTAGKTPSLKRSFSMPYPLAPVISFHSCPSRTYSFQEAGTLQAPLPVSSNQ